MISWRRETAARRSEKRKYGPGKASAGDGLACRTPGGPHGLLELAHRGKGFLVPGVIGNEPEPVLLLEDAEIQVTVLHGIAQVTESPLGVLHLGQDHGLGVSRSRNSVLVRDRLIDHRERLVDSPPRQMGKGQLL